MIKWVAISIFFISSFAMAKEQGDKYRDFDLKSSYGIGERDIRVHGVKTPDVIGKIFAKHYDVPAKLGIDGTRSYIELQPHRFAIAGQYIAQDKTIRNKVTKCDPSNNDKQTSQNCGYTILALVDTEKNILTRFDTRKMPEMAMNGLFFTGWKQGYRAYGCHIGKPLSAADLDLDGEPELFFIGGVGEFAGDSGGKIIQTNLFIFDTKNGINKLFKYELSYENYLEQELRAPTEFQSYTDYYIDKTGRVRIGDIKKGIRRYSKLFFKDFDKNDKLDILVWQREYQARLKSDPVKGYKLKKASFKLYEASPSGFMEKPITDEIAETYLEEHDLTWRKGFPNRNFCPNTAEDAPLVDNYPEQYYGKVHNIYDPMIQK